MSFFKKLFGGQKDQTTYHSNFQAGDIFYTKEADTFHVYKLLKIDETMNAFHVKGFKEMAQQPEVASLDQLEVFIHHFPIDRNGFSNAILLKNETVTEDDLLGYFEYIKQTNYVDELVHYAQSFYQQGYELSSQQNPAAAIERYSKAIDLIPKFYEAIDNRSFCFMDMGQWEKAIEGFQQSLEVMPDSLLAVFSIGECYLRLEDYPQAKTYFEKAVQIDPNHPQPKEFLEKTIQLMNA